MKRIIVDFKPSQFFYYKKLKLWSEWQIEDHYVT